MKLLIIAQDLKIIGFVRHKPREQFVDLYVSITIVTQFLEFK